MSIEQLPLRILSALLHYLLASALLLRNLPSQILNLCEDFWEPGYFETCLGIGFFLCFLTPIMYFQYGICGFQFHKVFFYPLFNFCSFSLIFLLFKTLDSLVQFPGLLSPLTYVMFWKISSPLSISIVMFHFCYHI